MKYFTVKIHYFLHPLGFVMARRDWSSGTGGYSGRVLHLVLRNKARCQSQSLLSLKQTCSHGHTTSEAKEFTSEANANKLNFRPILSPDYIHKLNCMLKQDFTLQLNVLHFRYTKPDNILQTIAGSHIKCRPTNYNACLPISCIDK